MDAYKIFWESMPTTRRLLHRVWWWVSSVWCAIAGRPGPGERMLLMVMKSEQDGRRDRERRSKAIMDGIIGRNDLRIPIERVSLTQDRLDSLSDIMEGD